jgi:SGNH hydrolase-like domain, acetyltransferase AlgX
LLSFFVGNDFVGPRRRRWYEFSYVTTLIYRAWKVASSYEGPRTPAAIFNYCDDCPTMTEKRYLNVEGGRSQKYIKGYKRFSRSVDAAMMYLEKIQALCKERGVQLVVVLIPDELQINRDLQKAVRAKSHSQIADNDWDPALPNRALAARLSKVGIDTIDLYDSFVVTGAKKNLYKPRDTHWNIAGNQLAANVIAAHLEKFANWNK